MKKKNKIDKKTIYIVICILGCILIISGLLVFVINKPAKIKVKNSKNEEKYDNTVAEEYMPYYDQIVQDAYYFDNYLSEKYPIKDINKLSAKDKTYILLNTVGSDENNLTTVQQLLDEMPKHFVPFDLYLGDIDSNDGEVLYKYENNIFTYITSEDLGYYMYTKELYNETTPTSWISKKKIYYLKAIMDGDKLRIDVYKTPKSKKKVYSYYSPSNISLVGLSDKDFDKVKDKLNTITYKYIKSGENYILKSIVTTK